MGTPCTSVLIQSGRRGVCPTDRLISTSFGGYSMPDPNVLMSQKELCKKILIKLQSWIFWSPNILLQLYTFFDPSLLPKRGDSQIEWLGSFDCCPRHRQDNYLSFSELILNAFFCYHSMESVPTLASSDRGKSLFGWSCWSH